MNINSLKQHLVEGPITYDFTLHDFGSVLGQPLHTFLWALTISWSRFLARVIVRALGSHTINMICRNVHQAYLLEVGSTQILANHKTLFVVCHARIHVIFSSMIYSYFEGFRPSPLSVNQTWTVSAL
jgi:hypothetical protein